MEKYLFKCKIAKKNSKQSLAVVIYWYRIDTKLIDIKNLDFGNLSKFKGKNDFKLF